MGTLCVAGQTCAGAATWKAVWRSLEQLEQCPDDLAVRALCKHPKELKVGSEEIRVHPCSQQRCSQEPTTGSHPVSANAQT